MKHLILLFTFSFLSATLSAQTSGQYELRKRNANGTYTSFGVTLSNGQVLGLTAGVPAAITPVVSGDLSAYLTSATAAATYQLIIGDGDLTIARTNGLQAALDAKLSTTAAATTYQPLATILSGLAALANASGVLTNNGSGTLSYTATTAGGNGASDSGKLILLDAFGGLTASGAIVVSGSTATRRGGLVATGVYWEDLNGSGFDQAIALTTPTAHRTHTLPDRSGTLLHADGNGSALTSLSASSLASGTVPTARLGSGTADSTTYLRGDNTWQTLSSGLTIGTTTITSGTSGRVLYNDGGVVGELTTTGSDSVVRATSPTLVTPNIGSATATSLVMGFGNITQVGSGQFYGNVEGNHFTSIYGRGALFFEDGDGYMWSNGSTFSLRYLTSAQAFRVANTWTSNTNVEWAVIDWRTTTNTLRIGSDVGSGGGTARDVHLIRGGVVKASLESGGLKIGTNGTAMAHVKRSSVTLVAVTATAADTDTTANTVVIMSVITPGGTVGSLDYDVSAGSSYTINSSSVLDTSTINLIIIHVP